LFVCLFHRLFGRWNAGRWDYEKSSLHSITEDIVKTASVVDSNLRQRVQDWITINRAMASAKSIATGSVLMRDLAGILKEEHVIDTESLCTLLVVVQKSMLRDWFSSYEALEIEDLKQLMGESGAFGARVVMPKSSVQITEDNDSVLMTCVVLRRFADQIKAKLRERKFMPREFSFDKGAGDNKEKSMEQLANKRLAARQDLLKFAQTQFSEILTCWVHLK
jgi:V-type H+-transporting ATPase subunit C